MDRDFRHVTFAWDLAHAAKLEGDEVALLVYRSNLLGSDPRITNFAGGNTSAKVVEPDPLSAGETQEVLWVKGSGGDLGTLTRSGLASLSLERLRGLRRRYRGRATEDEMVPLMDQCVVHGNTVAPSIDTPLHAFVPHRHVDHLHPDSVIALAAAADGEKLVREAFSGKVAWIPWQRPGFDLGLALGSCLAERPGIEGIVLAGHGLLSFGATSLECYESSLRLIERAGRFLEERLGPKASQVAFGKTIMEPLAPPERRARAAALAPVIRGIAGMDRRVVGRFRDDDVVLDFVGREKAPALARLGTSCPDHFLRTKVRPLLLDLPPSASQAEHEKRLRALAEEYRRDYGAYYDRCKRPGSPPLRGASPAIFLLPGVGMFSFGRTAKDARVAGEFYVNAVNVMRGAEGVSRYVPLPEREAFAIEYWALEEAKLKRLPPEKPFSRQVVFVTGGASGIGLACAERFLAEGAAVVLADKNEPALQEAVKRLAARAGEDSVLGTLVDLCDEASIRIAFDEASLRFGGIDVVVNNAGLSISKALEETTAADYDLMNSVMPRGSFLVSREAVRVLRAQRTGGSIVYVASKNALAAGPNNLAYGTAKAAQLHQMRLLAAEVGGDGIRVNAVNPDAVIKGSSIWSGGWAEGRAKAYGVEVDKLGAYYADRTILKREVLPEDVAAAVFALASDLFSKTTGAVIAVDGGLAMAFPR